MSGVRTTALLALAVASWTTCAARAQQGAAQLPTLGQDDILFLRLSRLATATSVPLERLPSTVKILTGDQVRRSGARFLPDALRMLPGVEVLRSSATEVSVNVRGFHSAATASQGIIGLVDGRQIYNPWLGTPVWDTIPVDMADLDRVEVLLGPGSFVYGPDAMHGVVNIVTKSPLDYDRDRFELGGSAGSYGSSKARLLSVQRDGKTAVKTTMVWDDIDKFEPSGASAKNMGFAEVRLESLFDDDDPLHRVDLTVNRNRHESSVLIPTLAVVPAATFTNLSDETFARAEYENHGFRAQASWLGHDATSTPDSVYASFVFDLDVVDLDLQYSADDWAGHHLTVGSGFRFTSVDTEDRDISEGRHDIELGWLFVQDELELAESWFVTAGLRYDYHSKVGPNLAPRLALIWEFDRAEPDGAPRAQSLRASYGHGFRYPSLRELWFDMPADVGPFTLPIVGNQNLDPERLQSFELAYHGAFGRSRLGLTGYYNLIEDLSGFVATVPAMLVNQRDEEAWGFEVDGEHPLADWLDGFANYSFARRTDRNGSIDRAPRHKVNAGLRAHLPSHRDEDPELGWHASVWVNWFDRAVLVNRPVRRYSLLNAHVGYDFRFGSEDDRAPRGSVFVEAFNLLDDDHREHPEGDRYGIIAMAGASITW